MINLLPDTRKSDIRAARANTILVRYILVLLLALAFISGVVFVSYESLKQSEASADSQLNIGDGSQSSSGSQASGNSNLNRIISTSTTPSIANLLTSMGRSLPQNSVINSLSIKPNNLQGTPFEIVVHSKQDVQNSVVESSLQSSGIFSSVQTSRQGRSNISGYDKTITFSVVLSSGSQYVGGRDI